MKEKFDKLDFTKTKNIFSAKDPVKRMKRQAIDLEKASVNHVSNKGLVSKIYKELSTAKS